MAKLLEVSTKSAGVYRIKCCLVLTNHNTQLRYKTKINSTNEIFLLLRILSVQNYPVILCTSHSFATTELLNIMKYYVGDEI